MEQALASAPENIMHPDHSIPAPGSQRALILGTLTCLLAVQAGMAANYSAEEQWQRIPGTWIQDAINENGDVTTWTLQSNGSTGLITNIYDNCNGLKQQTYANNIFRNKNTFNLVF